MRDPNELPQSLDDGIIRIRRLRAEDAPLLFEAAHESVAQLSPFLAWCQPGYSLAQAASWTGSRDDAWAVGAEFAFAIEACGASRLLGSVGLHDIDGVHRTAGLGYWVRTSATRAGVATAATRLAARFGIQEVGLQRVEILTAVHNQASQRVAEKAGAVREGLLRDRLCLDGTPSDAIVYSITRREPMR